MCNHCEFVNIVARANKAKKKVTLLPAATHYGVTVFVHPPDVDLENLEGIMEPGHPNRVKYFVAWFMELPEEHVS